MSILFDSIVFGPISSRRFGWSLGINLLPVNYKYCTFDCIYCECGWTYHDQKITLPPVEAIKNEIEKIFPQVDPLPDTITFAGNGEPTIHPDFDKIIDITIANRDRFFPKAKIAVLSNASLIHKPHVYKSLKKVDLNVLKLDAGTETMFQLINRPAGNLTLNKLVEYLKRFDRDELIIQTLFLRGEYNGQTIDNTTPYEVEAWQQLVREINPHRVMVYSIDRATPAKNLEQIGREELSQIVSGLSDSNMQIDIY